MLTENHPTLPPAHELTDPRDRIEFLNEAMLKPRSDMEEMEERNLEFWILRALANSAYPKKDLAVIARTYGIPLDEVDAIAKKLAKERGLDLEHSEFNAMVQQVKEIESIPDAGFREWKLQGLAKRYKRSRRELMEAYNKALIHQAPIVPLRIDELKKLSATSTDWTVQGWFPAGVTILFHGFGGTAKTLMLYGVAAAIAKGEAWNGYPVKQGEVLILQSDEPTHVTQERLEIMGVTNQDPLQVFPGWQVEAMPQLEAYLKARHESGSPVRFVMVDSNTSVNRNTLISENDVEYARPVLQLADLAARYGATIVIVHHSNANGDARGTKAIHNSVSEVWALSIADERTGDRLLRVQKNRLGRPPGRYKFEFDPNGYAFTYKGEEGDQEGITSTNEKRIELWLNEEDHRGICYEVEEISHFVNIPQSSVRRALTELWSKGIIQRKRKPNGRGGAYLYFAGELRESDHSNQSDRLVIDFPNSITAGDSAELDQSIGKTPKTFSTESDHFPDPVIKFGSNPDPAKVTEIDRQIDHPIDRAIDLAQIGVGDQVRYQGVNNPPMARLCGRKHLKVLDIHDGFATVAHDNWCVTQTVPLSDLRRV